MACLPQTSGRRIIDLIRESFEADISVDVEPSNENMGPLGRLTAILESVGPEPWELTWEEFSLAQILEKQAAVNELLPTLLGFGINVFIGTYAAKRQAPSLDLNEGMILRPRTPETEEKVCLVVVSDAPMNHIIRQPKDICPRS